MMDKMSDTDNGNSNDESRQAALADLSAELSRQLAEQPQIEIPKLTDIRENFTEQQEKLSVALFDPIVMPEFAHNLDPLAPTPGDPDNVFKDNGDGNAISYDDDVQKYLKKRSISHRSLLRDEPPELTEGSGVDGIRRVEHPFLSDEAYLQRLAARAEIEWGLKDVEREVYHGHVYHGSKNKQAMNRLKSQFLLNPEKFSDDEGSMIARVRTAMATDVERLVLLSRHPVLEAIESAEFTGALDSKGTLKALKAYGARVMELKMGGQIDNVTIFDPSNQPVTMRKINDRDGYGLTISKTTLAEATHNGVGMELVLKRRSERFPMNPQLPGVTPVHVALADRVVNFQPIAWSAYWRVKRQELPTMYVPRGSSSVAVQAGRAILKA